MLSRFPSRSRGPRERDGKSRETSRLESLENGTISFPGEGLGSRRDGTLEILSYLFTSWIKCQYPGLFILRTTPIIASTVCIEKPTYFRKRERVREKNRKRGEAKITARETHLLE
jgi:hypothetical protein